MNPKLLAAFDQHAAATFDKQSFLNDIVGSLDWQFDMEAGILSFGKKYQWNVQVLGTESEESSSWLWAWGNEASGIPDRLLEAANSLRQLGADQGLSELCDSQLPTDEYDGHFWSVLATGLCHGDAYYRGPYEGGAVFLVIKDSRYGREIAEPLARLGSVFPQAISTYAIGNHKNALVGHAGFLGLAVREEADGVHITDKDGNELLAQFDDRNRLASLAGKLSKSIESSPEERAAQKSASGKPVTFFEGWLRNCRAHYRGVTIMCGTISVVIGAIVWAFTSLGIASIAAAVAFVVLWTIGFIEMGE